MEYLIFFTLALFVTTMIMLIAGYIGSFFVEAFYTIDNARISRKLSVYGYHCFYINYQSMEKDANCNRILPILNEVYMRDSSFNPYCTRLSRERLPLNVMMNWARSISEDLFVAPIPSVKVDQWNHYWKSKIYTRMTFFHSDFPKYEDYELGCLWGAVFLWLVVCFDKDINDPLLNRIAYFGCKNKPAAPYFYHFFNAARKWIGKNYYLSDFTSFENGDGSDEFFTNSVSDNAIHPEDIYNGFEGLSVNERRNARKVLNDVLADCSAWKSMRNEMKQRGWFKETVSPIHETKVLVNGDYVLEKNVDNEVGNVESGGIGISITQNDD